MATPERSRLLPVDGSYRTAVEQQQKGYKGAGYGYGVSNIPVAEGYVNNPNYGKTVEPPSAPNVGRGEVRKAPDGTVQTGTNTGFKKLDLAGFEAFAGAKIVDPFAAAAKPGTIDHEAQIQVADKFQAPDYASKSTPKSNIEVDFTAKSSGFHDMPIGDVGNVEYDASKSAPMFKINTETGGGSNEIDFARREAFLDGPGGGLGGTKRVNAGLGYQQVGGKHFLRKGDEMVELDMANYGTGDQGFFAMKNAYRRGEIDAQTFLAGKTKQVKDSLGTSEPNPAESQNPNFPPVSPSAIPTGSEQYQDMSKQVASTPELDVNTGYEANVNPVDIPGLKKRYQQ